MIKSNSAINPLRILSLREADAPGANANRAVLEREIPSYRVAEDTRSLHPTTPEKGEEVFSNVCDC